MSAIDFQVCEWHGTWDSDPRQDATLASLRLDAGAGAGRVCLTEVYDQMARTVRPHINVSAYALARWLLLNWWRLRWEPPRRGADWLLAHSLAAIGEGYAWPPAVISSDGEFIQIQASAESACDVAAIRYLANAMLDVPAADFEAAVDGLAGQVQLRLSACSGEDRDLRELQEELAEERANPQLAKTCRLQAIAGFNPGDAPAGWLDEMENLRHGVGPGAIGELAAMLPSLRGGLQEAQEGVDQLRRSGHEIDLGWLRTPPRSKHPELPWEKGARLAVFVRQLLGQESGPLTDSTLGDCLGTALPMPFVERRALKGGFRSNGNGRTRVAVPNARPESQRFYLARLMGGALFASKDDHLLAVTDAGTAMQKCERSFAQELLCPWRDLDAFTDEKGLGDDAIADAGEHFQVSDWVIRTVLVNKHKLPRERLPQALQ